MHYRFRLSDHRETDLLAIPRHIAAGTTGLPMVHMEFSEAASKPLYDRFRRSNPAFQGAQ